MSHELRILLLIFAALLVGVAVLVVNPQYRVDKNLDSNRNYYPGIVTEVSADTLEPKSKEVDLDDDKFEIDSSNTQQDFEF